MATEQLVIGNTAKKGEKGRYSWVFYVRGAVHPIKDVIVELHPSFRDPVRTLKGPEFELKSSGWGTFDLEVVIRWQTGGEMPLTWELQFDRPDASTIIQIPKALLAPPVEPAVVRGRPVTPRSVAPAPSTAGPAGYTAAPAPNKPRTVVGRPKSATRPKPKPRPMATALKPAEPVPVTALLEESSGESSISDGEEDSDAAPADAHSAVSFRDRSASPSAVGTGRPSSSSSTGRAPSRPGRSLSRPRLQVCEEGDHEEEGEHAVSADARTAICTRLCEVGNMSHGDPLFMHGRVYAGPMKAPECIWKSTKKPRDDHDASAWLTASEFRDQMIVMKAKCKQLATMIRLSRKTVAYTGAGISAAVIGQAARSGQNKQGWKPDTRTAKPTFTHHALGFLGMRGLIHSWVQQNHDGLPQKAGFPQENINEIHGSWYDPSNPVVKYSGSLHDRAFPWMENDAETADLVLVLGTSLGGLNADQVATSTADRSLEGGLGTVIINLQQTEQDGRMTLRCFGKSDDILRLLLVELGFGKLTLTTPVWPRENRILVPYDANGRRCENRLMWWDLNTGQLVRITAGHNIQGARQPQYMHIGARKPVTRNGVTKQPAIGNGYVERRDDDSASFMLNIEGASMRLGIWWLATAARGAVEALPVVNQKPSFQ